MATKRYCVFVIPAAHRAVANVLMAIVNGDDPQVSDSFSVKANPSGLYEDPPTHYYGGWSTSEEWLSQVSNLAADLVPLPDGMAWEDYGTSEAAAIAAAEAIHLQVTITQNGDEPSSEGTLNMALAELGLQKVPEPR